MLFLRGQCSCPQQVWPKKANGGRAGVDDSRLGRVYGETGVSHHLEPVFGYQVVERIESK
jgi:hypothetical protein